MGSESIAREHGFSNRHSSGNFSNVANSRIISRSKGTFRDSRSADT